MKLFVFFGNPGENYKYTRHNAGVLFGTFLVKRHPEGNYKALFPKKYMNETGDVVFKEASYYKIAPQDIWLAHDDVDLPVGEYRIHRNRGSAGHRGVNSVFDSLNTKDLNRIRIGVGKSASIPTDKWVLQDFSEEELKIVHNCFPSIDNYLGPNNII